ncbi:MAG: phosphoenolpyruvate--protein phosphotransferase [Hyphomicrobiales bacterium]
MQPALVGPRILLRRLREVMAEPETAQKRLDKIATLIASNMVAEVCSIYVMRPGGVLELFATEGLNPGAVHRSTLGVGEGLVGVIAHDASPLNLSDAQHHPAFKYLPETGEEIYQSFLGVPILRAGLVLGVLTVQNRTQRNYSEEEEEALQTTAMVLAEVIAAGELDEVSQALEVDVAHLRSHSFTGSPLAGGVALGHVVLHQPRVLVTNLIAEDLTAEHERLNNAVDALRLSVDHMLEDSDLTRPGEHQDVLEAYRMFAHDRGWLRRLGEAVDSGLTAEAAVERVQSDTRARLLRSDDPYLRERLHDFDDLANRLLRILAGVTGTAAAGELPKDAIVVAVSMGPAELLDYDRERIRGLVIEEGGGNSHVTVVARALGVPMVGQVENIAELADTGDPIIVDGQRGEVHVRPSTSVEEAYTEKVRLYARKQEQFQLLRDKPSVTKDGSVIDININAGLLVDLPHLDETGAHGIGLFRTELQFMIASAFPRMDEQVTHYRAILDAAGDRPVIFRTLDIGADKVLPYLRPGAQEDNPALGWRAIRMSLERPALLRLQLRALAKAAGDRDLHVMFPMVAEVDEFRRARAMLEHELDFVRQRGHAIPSKLQVGAMIEVPALLWQMPALLPLVDFISVGSNDLMQFMFAYDRGDPRLVDRYDTLSPPLLKLMSDIFSQADAYKVPVTVCGEIAGDPLSALALIGLGLRSLSVVPAAVGPVKNMVRSLDADKARELLQNLLDRPDHSVRKEVENFAIAYEISINN